VQDYSDATSPASKAGIKAGDVIVSVDGKRVDYVAQLQEAIAFRKPGDVVSVEVARKGGEHATVKVPLQRAVGATATPAESNDSSTPDEKGSSMHALGASVTAIDAATAQRFQLPANVKGVMVTDVQDGTSAATHLATPSTGGPDIILSVEGTAVQTPDQLRAALANVKAGDVVSLNVYNVPAKAKRIERVRIGDK